MSSTVFITLLTEICDMLKKNKKTTRDRMHSSFKDICGKLEIIDNPSESDAINQLANQFKILCDVIKTVLTANDIIPNPSNPVSSTRYKNDFEEIKFIASGSFGNVYKARHHLDQHEYAIKKICVTREKSYKILKILEEVKTLARLQHRNIISYRNAWIENGPLENVPLIPDSGDDESTASSKNIDSHHNSRDNSPQKSSQLSNCFRKLSVRDSKESGCSSTVEIRTNGNNDSDSDGSSNSNGSKINICENNDADFHGQLKPPVINKGISRFNDKSIGNSNSSESIDSFIVFREENSNSNSNSPPSASSSKENSSNDGDKSSSEEYCIKENNIKKIDIEENNSNLKRNSQQVCEYKPRPDVLTLYIQMALCEQTLRKWLDKRNKANETSPESAEVIIKLLIADPNERPSADNLLEEFETNKDFIIDRLKADIEDKEKDIEFLTNLNFMLLNSLKKEKETLRGVKIKRVLGGIKDKHLKKK
ncbi:GSCOCG00004560001-RA-CDS [Cotesia congregata]|nr:GSCOCG00004560001-RA-CDS [Cotesia congregata]